MIAMSEGWVRPPRIPLRTAPFAAGVLDSRAMDLEYLMVPGAPPPPPTAPYSTPSARATFSSSRAKIPSDPRTGDRLVPGGIVEQTHQVMKEPPDGARGHGHEPRPCRLRAGLPG